ncbi:MAG: glycerol-3-phosphate dehydrogenase, partial [Desulfovibrio sp.]
MNIAVLGGGAWGTTLANLLAAKGLPTSLWVNEPELAGEIRAKGENTWFLPGVPLDSRLKA